MHNRFYSKTLSINTIIEHQLRIQQLLSFALDKVILKYEELHNKINIWIHYQQIVLRYLGIEIVPNLVK